MEDNNKIVLKSVYSKTSGQSYHILPCKDPATQQYPPHVRECFQDNYGKIQMVLSEDDKKAISKGVVFIPADVPIVVTHNTEFDLNNPLQRAQWEAIKYSKLIALNRLEKDSRGNYVIDGEKVTLSETNMAKGRYGLADLYVEHPGIVSKSKNDYRKRRAEAERFIMEDNLEGMILKCKLLEKDMSRANSNDIEDYLFTLAEKNPDKIISLYTGTDTENRLLLIDAQDKHIIIKRDGLLIYSDNIVLGASLDAAVAYLGRPEAVKIKELLLSEVYPNLQKKSNKANKNDD